MNLEIFVLYAIIVLQSIVIARFVYKTKNKQEISKPESLKIIFIRKENKMALVYGLSCKAPVDGDVLNRRLVVNVNGNDVAKNTYSGDTVDFGEFTFSQGDDVVVILVDVDDAGNESEPATVQFQAMDTIAPKVPGGFSVSLLREVEDTVPVVDPVTPEPVVDPTTPEPVVDPVTPEPEVTPGPSGV